MLQRNILHGCFWTGKDQGIKASFYDLRKDQAKIDEFNKKRKEKIKENEKNNVKIPYIYMILLGVIGFVVETIGTLIAVI